MQTELTINPELRDLLPPLSPEEFIELEASIAEHGCLSQLLVWGDVIVDGHNRYEICSRLGIKFETKEISFKNLAEAKFWIWQHQKGRRNANAFLRGEMALKFKDVIMAKAKARQRGGQGGILLCQKSDKANKIDTKKELAKSAEVSHDTLLKIEFILEHGSEQTKATLRSTKKETTINKEYQRLKAEWDAKQPAKPKKTRSTTSSKQTSTAKPASEKPATKLASEEKPKATEAKADPSIPTGLYCRPGEKPGATGEPYVTKSSLTDMPHNMPEVLVAQLIAHFPREYTRQCPFLILDALRANDGSSTTMPLARDIWQEFGEK